MNKSINLIINALACNFGDCPKNTLSDAAKFARGLCCLGNDLLNVLWYVSATISETPCPQPNFLVRN
ncbi:MAG: hypothetical protein JJU13_18550, partial [Balneolaceae bacterium]|nr:hypothetical protein [Balneolaceae bacterium]